MPKIKTDFKQKMRSSFRIWFPILVVSSLVVILAVLHTGPKDVATAEQVWDAIEEAGYQPVDATELYTDDMPNLIQCIAFERDDEYFNFYVFKEKSDAGKLYSDVASHIKMCNY